MDLDISLKLPIIIAIYYTIIILHDSECDNVTKFTNCIWCIELMFLESDNIVFIDLILFNIMNNKPCNL